MAKSEKSQYPVRISLDEFKVIRHLMIDRDVPSFQDLVMRLLRRWVDGEEGGQVIAKHGRPTDALLGRVQEALNGPKGAQFRAALRSMLDLVEK